ncbi:MAG: SGNH/GDSL hydrolase family protein [Lachnospiraceae bacterium]|nr:SGNH/GDSL hydrolase family protein [Lachnospiraceae bacterium]
MKKDMEEKEVKKIHYNTKWNILFVILSVLLIAGLVYMMYNYLQEEQQTQAHWEEVKLQVDAERKIEEQEAIEAAQKAAEEEAIRRAELEKEDSFYQKLKDGFDVDILVVGDTIATAYGATKPEYSWVRTIELYLEQVYQIEVNITNLALADSSAYAGYANLMMLNDEIEYDLALICYGEKDSAESIDVFYEPIIRAVRDGYPKCSMIAMLEATSAGYIEKAQRIQTIAEHYDIPVVDAIEGFSSGEYAEFDELTDDGIHPNDTGHQLYAYLLSEVIDAEVKAYTGYDSSEVEPLSDMAKYFETFAWYSVDNFTRDGETYIYTMTGFELEDVLLGIDFGFVAGDNSCEITVDGESLGSIEKTFAEGEEEHQIMPVGILEAVRSELVIKFATPEQADAFRGIYFNQEYIE